MTVFDVRKTPCSLRTRRLQYDYQVASYRENVLTGFQQVEDNLATWCEFTENEAKVQDERTGHWLAQHSLELSIKRYNGGVTDYLEVNRGSKCGTLSDEVTAVNILGRRMAGSTVLLIQALGGGWDRSSLPERAGMLRQACEQQFQLTRRVIHEHIRRG